MPEIETFTAFVKRIVAIVIAIILIISGLFLLVTFIASYALGLEVPGYLFDPLQALPLLYEIIKADWFRVIVFPGFTWAMLIATEVIYLERKFLAKMQYRVGPLYAGKYEGVLQPIADFFKLMAKEIIIPRRVDRFAFMAAPFALMAVAVALLSVIPVSRGWFIADIGVGLLVFFAVLGLSPIIALIAGWASNSKYPFLGALRALHQMVAYEIPMILSALGVVVLAGSLRLSSIVEAQSNFWFVLLQPIGALVFFIGALAELERIPLDLPHAEPELVAGWLTEYSGMAYGLAMVANYVRFYAVAALFTTLFLGGWHGPMLLPPGLEEVSMIVWFTVKTVVVMLVMIILRGANPRVRIDLLLRMGWTRLLALAFANIFMAMLLVPLGVAAP